MKLGDFFRLKYLVLAFAIGMAFMCAFTALIELIGGEEPAVLIAMWPGVILSRLSGYGGHDLPGLLLYMLGNVVFYWALAFLVLAWWVSRRQISRNDGRGTDVAPKDGTGNG
jgi:hypothetical protein